MTHSPAPRDPVGADEGSGWTLVEEAAGASGAHWLLSARAPLRVPGVAPVVIVPVVWRPLALVLIVLVPLLGILLILVIARLRVGLCSRGRWWGVGCWGVAAVAPIIVGRWRWRWRWWGCIALAVSSLVVGWLAVTRLRRAVAADGGGAGAGAGARDVAVLAVAAGPWWVPSRAVAGRWRRLLRWRLWRWWLLWGWLLLGSAAVAASVVGVVIPAVVTPAVRVIATTSAAVETSSVAASSTAASPSVLEASSVAPGGASVVVALETATTPTAPEATAASVVKALFRGWPSLAAFLVVLPHQLVCFLPLQLNEQHLVQEVPSVWQREVGFHFQDRVIWDVFPFLVGSLYCSVF